MAVNVLGAEVEETDKISPVAAKELTYSPYDDLAFVMYVDNEIAGLVRSLDEKKRTAVRGKYYYNKNIFRDSTDSWSHTGDLFSYCSSRCIEFNWKSIDGVLEQYLE